jgi:hypothetical protein
MLFALCFPVTERRPHQPDVIEETPMTFATQMPARSRARLSTVTASRQGEESCRIEIVENPIHRLDAALAGEIEGRLRALLAEETLGSVTVRFRVCRDESDGFQFICKIENPPRVETDLLIAWRWWSPLMASADDFSVALEEGLRVRRARLTQDVPRA